MMYASGSCCLLIFSSSSFYFFLVWQSISLFALIHYFGGFIYNVNSISYVLVTLLSDIMIIYGFVSVSTNFLFFGFMLKLSFFPFLWFVPNIILNLPYSLFCFLVFFHKVVVIILCYYVFLGFSFFYTLTILLSIFISSLYLILNKGCLKSLLVWSSNIHCGWFLLLLSSGSYSVFTYISIYLFFGLFIIYVLVYGFEYYYLYEIVGLDSGLGFWFWFSFLFFCSFPPMLGWVLKFVVYFSAVTNYVVLILVIFVNLFSTFGYLVVLSSFFVSVPSYNFLSLFSYLVPFSLLLLGLFLF
uniref:NADH dehydrogenase subunit 2 n=1 Tax=Dugesia japonica TaxID=6161 RepID=G9M8V9_DUGJA|nr:NADH dehydrogenase subunit 2 [Dugesia japonica]